MLGPESSKVESGPLVLAEVVQARYRSPVGSAFFSLSVSLPLFLLWPTRWRLLRIANLGIDMISKHQTTSTNEPRPVPMVAECVSVCVRVLCGCVCACVCGWLS